VEGYVDSGRGCPALRKSVDSLRPEIVICGHDHIARGLIESDNCDEGCVVKSKITKGHFGKQQIILEI
jgi:Icc-related predicted phosphoesterase